MSGMCGTCGAMKERGEPCDSCANDRLLTDQQMACLSGKHEESGIIVLSDTIVRYCGHCCALYVEKP